MTAKGKIIKIGFDLDGVIIDKPPFIPKRLIEWLYRGRINTKLSYRYPGKIEKWIRWLSHHSVLRPPIKKNVEKLRELSKNKNYKLYAISSRYSFLEKRTKEWFQYYKLNGIFEEICLNLENDKPHKFKEKTIKKLGIGVFIDDDELLVNYLRKKVDARVLRVSEAGKEFKEFGEGQKIKVLIGISYYYPNISGLTTYVRRLAEELVKKGYEVTVLTSRYDKSLLREEIMSGVKIQRSLVLFKIGKGVFMPFLPLEVFRLAKNSDVINCHLPQFESFVFATIGKLLGKKVILTHHTDLSGWKGFFNRISEVTLWTGQVVAGFLSDKIAPYTKDYADNSWYLKLFRHKLEFIYPPIASGKLDVDLKKKWFVQIGKPKWVVGFAGRIAKQKGIPYLLGAIPYLETNLQDFKIVFAGPYKGVVGERYYDNINKLIHRFRKHLYFLGPVEQKDMATFYSMCDVLVLPSDDRLESFGIVQVEAMLNSCPVVATNLPGVRIPIKKTGMGLLVPPQKPELLAQGIVRVLNNKKGYIKPRKEVEYIFSFDSTIQRYEKLFRGD